MKTLIFSTCKKIFATLALFIIPATFIFAHPHVFIKDSSEFVFNGSKLDGIWETWEFDRVFSADIISWLDVNTDGDFNADESLQVYNNAFINLQHYYYYTFIRQRSERTNPTTVTKFRAHAKDGLMTYRFYIDLSQYEGNDIYFAVYDYTYFCDIEYIKPITITYDEKFIHPTYKVLENENYPVYYNPVGAATDTTIYYKPGPGLYTYYPKEIHISW